MKASVDWRGLVTVAHRRVKYAAAARTCSKNDAQLLRRDAVPQFLPANCATRVPQCRMHSCGIHVAERAFMKT